MSLKCQLISGINEMCSLIDELTALLDKVCGPCEDEPLACPPVPGLSGPDGGDASWTSGPDIGQALTYPTPIDTNIRDWATTLTVDEAKIAACCESHTPESAMVVRFHMLHKLIGLPHTGFVLSTSAGQFTATSPTNTSTLGGGYPSQAVGVGATSTQQDADFVDRWVDITATCADFIAGVTLSTFAFEGNGTGTYDEQLNGLSAEVIKIEGC